MQTLRKSLQNKSSSGVLNPNRSQASLVPPRKVIKALYDYNSQQSEELSFTKGDFFHVIGNEDDEDWYEAYNPVTGARGYVPVTYFQILEKSQRNSNQGADNSGNDTALQGDAASAQNHSQQGYFQPQPTSNGGQTPGAGPKTKFQPLYGIVLFDFSAERADELDAKAGDAILVIAQSNDEWYVAKPIGRLGGPGLIPVNFIEIRDMASGRPINVPEMLRQTGMTIPRVEEWKKQTMEYKANSIPLGKLDAPDAQQQQQQQPQSPPQQQQQLYRQPQPSHGMHPQQFMQQQQANQNNGPTLQQLKNKMSSRDLKSPQKDQIPRGHSSQDFEAGRHMTREDSNGRYGRPTSNRANGDAYDSNDFDPMQLVNAAVESYHHENDQYWFTVRAEYASGAVRTLYRVYEDFYNFHIALLEEFPVESGRVGDQPRILPFMPIPLQVVTEAVTASRRADLDGYVKDLCVLPMRITQHPLVEQLFALKDGDVEIPPSGSGNGSASPPQGRSTPSGSMFYSDRRASPSGSRLMGAKQIAGGLRGYSDDPPSTNASPSLRSQAVFSTPAGSGSSEEMIKVKISFQEDIMAMRIPVAITFRALQQKIFDRLETQDKELSYRDERGDLARIQDDMDVREAIDHSGGKLMIYVD